MASILILSSFPLIFSESEIINSSNTSVESYAESVIISQLSQTAIQSLEKIPKSKSMEERKQKFDSEFHGLIQSKILANSTSGEYHDVVIFLNYDNVSLYSENYSPQSRADINKKIIANHLQTKLGAKDIFIGESLSIVIASVPVDQILKLGDYDQIKFIGNGETKLNLALDNSKDVINSVGIGVTGLGTKVAIIDTGIDQNHDDLPIPQSVIDQITCGNVQCPAISSDYSDDATPEEDFPTGHGTHVAGIIMGIGQIDSSKKGVAPDAHLLNIKKNDDQIKTFLRGMDYAINNGFKIINISSGLNHTLSSAITLMLGTDEAVDLGGIVVASAGNQGPAASSIEAPAAAFNAIAVGNMDDKNSNNSTLFEIREKSARGPTISGQLKPELSAPGTLIDSPGDFSSGDYAEVNGTSFAAPHVTGSIALITEKHPEFDSLEIKGALFTGASWKGESTYTAKLYETPYQTDIPNAWGFGLIDVQKSLEISDSGNKIIRDTIVANQTKGYLLDVIEDEQTKVFLIWENHPNGTIISPSSSGNLTNLDLEVFNSNDSIRALSDSNFQNIEFGIFSPEETSSQWSINVTASSIQSGMNAETFVLASTRPITPLQTVECFPRDMTPFDWFVYSNCTLFQNSTVLGNVTITNNSTLTIPNGIELNIDFINKKLVIENGSGIFIQSGGKIT